LNNKKRTKNFLFKSINSEFTIKILIFLIPIFIFWQDLKKYFDSEHPLISSTQINFKNINNVQDINGSQLSGNWKIENEFLGLKGNEKGVLELKLEKYPQTKFFADFWIKKPDEGYVQLELSSGNGKKLGRWKVKNWEEQRFNWSRKLRNENIFYISIYAEAGKDTTKFYPILKMISATSFKPQTLKIIPWYGVLMLILIAEIWFMIIMKSALRKNLILIGWIAWVVILLAFKIFPILHHSSIIFYILFSIPLIYLALQKCKEKRGEIIAFIFFGLILLIGFSNRWDANIIFEGVKLEYDEEDYLKIATKFSKGLFDTATDRPPWVREPLFIWILKLGFLVLPETAEGLRMISLIISLISIFAIYHFGKKHFGIFSAIGASFLVATIQPLINFGVLGLRFDLFILVIILFLSSVIQTNKTFKQSFLTGVLAGLNMLVRITALVYILPLTIFFAIKNRWKLSHLLISLILPLILVSPHLIFNYKFQGSKDILFSSNIHTRFYRNIEFAGKQGFPSAEEVKKNPYLGPQTSTFKYLFLEHSPSQVIYGFFRGGVRIFLTKFTYEILFTKNNILLTVYILGMIGLIFSKNWWLFIVYFFLSFPVLYVANLPINERLILYLAPFQFLGMFVGWDWISCYITNALKRKIQVNAK